MCEHEEGRRPDGAAAHGEEMARKEEMELVELVKARSRPAMRRFMTEYNDVVQAAAWRYMGPNRQRGEDDTVDCYRQLWEHLILVLPRWPGTMPLAAWVHTVVDNKAKDCRRAWKRLRRRETHTLDELPEEPAAPTTDPAEAVAHEDLCQAVRTAVASLPEKQRTALTLYTYLDYTYQQVADEMGVPLDTAASYISRAKKQLRKLLVKEYPYLFERERSAS